MTRVMGRLTFLVALTAGLGCKDTDVSSEKLEAGAAFLETMFEPMEKTTQLGAPCYPLIDGYVRSNVQEFGHRVAKDVRRIEDYLDFATIALEIYKTPAGDRYDAFARKYQAWKNGPYTKAVEACEVCARNGQQEDTRDTVIRHDLSSCLVP